MKIDIDTKFNVGDRVWTITNKCVKAEACRSCGHSETIYEYRPTFGKVDSISLYIDQKTVDFNDIIVYDIHECEGSRNETCHVGECTESTIFKTKKEAQAEADEINKIAFDNDE